MPHVWRWISGIVFIPLFVLLVKYGGIHLYFFFLSIGILVALREFFNMLKAKGYHPHPFLGYFLAWLILFSAYWGNSVLAPLLTLTFALIVLLLSLLLEKEELNFRLESAATTYFGLIYVAWLMTFLQLVRQLPLGPSLIFYLFLITWSNDTGAFYAGRAWGQRKLAPVISPNKSVEGALGGLFFGLCSSFVAKYWFFPQLALRECLFLGLLLGVCGQLGDLVESMLKRSTQVKDAGNAIPGHGGILDRVDSLLFTAPVLYLYAILFF